EFLRREPGVQPLARGSGSAARARLGCGHDLAAGQSAGGAAQRRARGRESQGHRAPSARTDARSGDRVYRDAGRPLPVAVGAARRPLAPTARSQCRGQDLATRGRTAVNAQAQPSRAFTRTVLAVPGMHCAGCMSKVEHALSALPGVSGARVNLSGRTVAVMHSPELEEPDLIDALGGIGFEAQPRRDDLAPRTSATRPLLAPLAVAGFAAMNVMTLSVSIWAGADGSTRSLFHWLSALIAVPAVAYAGMPFFRSAWSVLKRGRTNMDVPISIGVVLAT